MRIEAEGLASCPFGEVPKGHEASPSAESAFVRAAHCNCIMPWVIEISRRMWPRDRMDIAAIKVWNEAKRGGG